MKLYHYSERTKEYVGSTSARRDPLEPDKFLIPARAVTVSPPVPGQNEAVIWNGSEWEIVPDYRGTKYYLPSDDFVEREEEHEVKELGILPPPDASPTMYPLTQEQQEIEMISQKSAEITRRAAIAELKSEGKLPPDYKES